MDTDLWYHEKAGGVDFNWTIKPGGIWQVKLDDTVPETTGSNRHKWDLYTRCCFRDFSITLEFRCPMSVRVGNTTRRWKVGKHVQGERAAPCSSPLFGTRNWGNSGVCLLNSYEIQIHDSYKDPADNPIPIHYSRRRWMYATRRRTLRSDLLEDQARCNAGEAGKVRCQLCTDWRLEHHGDILHVSPVHKRRGETKKATVSVKINGVFVQGTAIAGKSFGTGVAIEDRTSGSRFVENPAPGGTVADNLYGVANWVLNQGPIVLQQHDNFVQFQNIKITPGWKPTTGTGAFDAEWQKPV